MERSNARERSVDAHADRDEEARKAILKLGELIRDIQTAMLTSVTVQGHLRSRPMPTQQSELDDELWLFVDARSDLIDDITENHQVNLTYVDPKGQRYISVSGVAHVMRDQELLRKFWQSRATEWFPDGPEPGAHMELLRVQLEEAEYWDVPSRSMIRLFGFASPEKTESPAKGVAPIPPNPRERDLPF